MRVPLHPLPGILLFLLPLLSIAGLFHGRRPVRPHAAHQPAAGEGALFGKVLRLFPLGGSPPVGGHLADLEYVGGVDAARDGQERLVERDALL